MEEVVEFQNEPSKQDIQIYSKQKKIDDKKAKEEHLKQNKNKFKMKETETKPKVKNTSDKPKPKEIKKTPQLQKKKVEIDENDWC